MPERLSLRLKRERAQRIVCTPLEDARSDAFDYMLYNAKRRYDFNNQLSPVAFKKRYAMNV